MKTRELVRIRTFRILAAVLIMNMLILNVMPPSIAQAAPLPPSGLTATVINAGQVNLSWTDNSLDETSFRVERAVNNLFTTNLVQTSSGPSVATGTVNFSDTTTASLTTYFYRVFAVNGAGDSTPSNVASITTIASAPQITQVQPNPAASQVQSGAPNVIGATAVSPGSSITSLEWQSFFNPAPFTALEVSAQAPLAIPPTRAANPVPDTRPVPVGLPAGSVALVVVIGVVTAVNTTTGEWRIGTQPVFVYESADTKIVNAPVAGDEVKVVASRALAGGPIVAEKITRITVGPVAAEPAVVEIAFLFNGTVQSVLSFGTVVQVWNVGGVLFRMNDPELPAAIDPGLGVGSAVTVEFDVPSTATGNIALEISAQAPLNVTPTAANPVFDTRPATAGAPASSVWLFVVSGIVTQVNASTGEWRIGSQPVFVYQSAATVFRGARVPVAGDEVRVIAQRTLAPGPIVADVIALVTPGPLTIADAELGTALLFNGVVQATTAATWMVSGVNFIVNDPFLPAAIDAGLIVGSSITVEFTVAGAPVAPDPVAWRPLIASNPAFKEAILFTPPVAANVNGFLFFRATDAAGQVTISTATTALLAAAAAPPLAPSLLAASVINPNQVSIAWTDNASNEASFRMERSTTTAFTQNLMQKIVPLNITTFIDMTAPANSTLFYRVLALNGAGASAASNTVQVTTTSAGAPANLTAVTAGAALVNLSWSDNSTNETGFRIDRAKDIAFTVELLQRQVGMNVSAFVDTAVAAGATYFYRVFAITPGGVTGGTNVAQVSLAAPASPVSLTAIRSGPQVNLSWMDMADNETGFTVERATDEGFTLNLAQFPVSASIPAFSTLTFTDTTVTPNSTFFYRVLAVNAVGNSAASNISGVTTPPSVPVITLVSPNPANPQLSSGAPNLVAVNVNSPGAAISSARWQLLAGAAPAFTAAEIFAGIPLEIPPTWAANPTANSTPIPAGLPNSAIGLFVVQGVVTAINSTTGEWRIGSQPVFIYESAATILAGARAPTVGDLVRVIANRTLHPGPLVAEKITLRTPGPQAVVPATVDLGFLFRGTVQAAGVATWTVSGFTFVVNDSAAPAAIDAGLGVGSDVVVEFTSAGGPVENPAAWASLTLDPAPGSMLWVAVATPAAVTANTNGFLLTRATDILGGATFMSTTVTLLAAPLSVPATPAFLIATAAAINQVDLTWTDNANNEAIFRIERSTTSAFTQNLVQMEAAANATAFSDFTAPVNTTLFYRVLAVNAAGASPSNVATVAISAAGIPGGLSAVYVSANQVNLSWTDNSSVETGFRIDRATDLAFTRDLVQNQVSANMVSFSDTTITANSTFFYRVVALTPAGPSLPSNVIAVQVGGAGPAAPTGLSAVAAGPTQVNLSWTDNSASETGFRIDRARDGGFIAGLVQQTLAANVKTFTDSNLAPVTTYFYRVAAINGAGLSAPSNTVSVTTSGGGGASPPPEAPPVAGGGGGGGGGSAFAGGSAAAGGGAPAPSQPGGTAVTMMGFTSSTAPLALDTQGKAVARAVIQNSAGSVVLTIPEGALVTDENKQPLSVVSATPLNSPPPPPPGRTIIFGYNLFPNGARFSPPITLSMKYDPAKLPTEAKEINLVIAYWDGTKWVEIGGKVDTVAKTVTVDVNHFTEFAVMTGREPASAAAPATVAPPVTAPALVPAPVPVVAPAPALPAAEPEPAPVPEPAAPAPEPVPAPAPIPVAAPVPEQQSPAPVFAPVPVSAPAQEQALAPQQPAPATSGGIIGMVIALAIITGMAIFYMARRIKKA